MNPQLIQTGLELALAAFAFLREAKNDDAVLQAIVDKAHAEGRTVDLADVKASLTSMHDAGNSLAALIAAKKAG